MDNEKNIDFEDDVDLEAEQEPSGSHAPAPRARNRTVMLTPDITGEMRARMAKDLSEPRMPGGDGERAAPGAQFFGGYGAGPRVPSASEERPRMLPERALPEREPERCEGERPLRALGAERDLERPISRPFPAVEKEPEPAPSRRLSGGEKDLERTPSHGRTPLSAGDRDLERALGRSVSGERPAARAGGERASERPAARSIGGEHDLDRGAPRSGALRPGAATVAGAPIDPPAHFAPPPPRVNNTPPPVAPVQPARASGDRVLWGKQTRVVGFLVSFDKNENGDVFELRMGRLIVSSENAGAGNCLLLEDETVSPMHAILRINKGGAVQVLDQLSEHGTKIRRYASGDEEELSGDKGALEHGDVVIFGKREFSVCIIATER